MRYRRFKKRYNGTRFIKMKFQSFMDIATSSESMQIISISAGGPNILKRLAPMFSAFKYYKIGNISVKLVPASTLPVDPTGLSYEAGENTVDPRDQLTPGMMRITNGEDIFEDISQLNASQQARVYNAMLLDQRWFKFMLQSGVKRHATPRYWTIGQLHQDKWPGSIVNYPAIESGEGTDIEGTIAQMDAIKTGTGKVSPSYIGGSSPYGFFQTGHRGVLGWLPTDGLAPYANGSGSSTPVPLVASPVEVEVMKIILPKMHKTNYYYRAYISETVYFKEPILTFNTDDTNHFALPLDIFHRPSEPIVDTSAHTGAIVNPFPQDSETGGNYGNN